MLVYERRLARQERVEPLGNVGADALRIRVDQARRVNPGGLAGCDRPVRKRITPSSRHVAGRREVQGMPQHLVRGARLAAMRIRDAADSREAELLDGNRFMPMGGEWTAPDAPIDAPVRLS